MRRVATAAPCTAIDVSAGETVTCTFTNTELSSIKIVKNSNGGDDTFNYTVTGATPYAGFSIATVAEPASTCRQGSRQGRTA